MTKPFYYYPTVFAILSALIIILFGVIIGEFRLLNQELDIVIPPLKICETPECWIKYYSKYYGIDYQLPLKIAVCENRLKNIKHKNGSGIFAFIQTTWEQECSGDIMNIRDNTRCGVKLISGGKLYHWGYPVWDKRGYLGNKRWGSRDCWENAT